MKYNMGGHTDIIIIIIWTGHMALTVKTKNEGIFLGNHKEK
jgi:hypothetical protein